MKTPFTLVALTIPLIIYLISYEPRPWLVLIAAFVIVLLILYGLITILARRTVSRGILDFLVSDEGTYSLSRFQAVMWGITVLTSQVAVMLMFASKSELTLRHFQLVFSESAIWLLGLSLTSYVSVKGISVKKINEQPQLFKSKTPQPSNIIMGSNGLDFSKCQMLVWTIIGVIIFSANTYYFLGGIDQAVTTEDVVKLFNNHYEEYSKNQNSANPIPFVPYLPWSFVVLMGLSQGGYVGKKLIPSFKLDQVSALRENELKEEGENLETKKLLLSNLAKNNSAKIKLSKLDVKNQQVIMGEIENLEKQILETKNEIRDIEVLKNAPSI